MSLQNRVTPWGEFVATSARGTLMGNRGILHDETGTLGAARWKHNKWVTCRLEFRGRRREPMPAGGYTALFFLDEATALAAGHRPCGECRRENLAAFRAALGADRLDLATLDRHLHGERTDRATRQVRPHVADIATLPDGTMILTPDGSRGGPTCAALVWGDALHPWTVQGYRPPLPRPVRGTARVLTPPTIRRALAGGYRAAWLGG